MSQSNLLSFFGGRKRQAEENIENESSRPRLECHENEDKTDNNTASADKEKRKSSKSRTFRDAWLSQLTWLRKVDENGEVRACCIWCCNMKKKNMFASESTSKTNIHNLNSKK